MRHGSLFSGIGGFDLAAQWMGWDNVFHVEWNPWCRKVLEYHFPNSQSFTDVKQFDGTAWRGHVDIISGGFPCQPYSAAGKRLGKDDERHLWPEMLRIICEAAPRFVVGENVRGITNWNGGVVFEEVCLDLEAEGYEVWTGILPAAGVGAPHRRDRVWFVAHAYDHGAVRTSRRNASASNSQGVPERDEVQLSDQSGGVWDVANAESDGNRGRPKKVCSEERRPDEQKFAQPIECGEIWNAADTSGKRLHTKPTNGELEGKRFGQLGEPRKYWQDFPTQPPICGGNDGLPRELDGITFLKWRNESIKAYGNAIVPQVAYEIFKAIQQTNENRSIWNH